MKWIGLTGGIASGKSTVSRLLTDRMIAVIDADQISHELTQINAEGYQKIVRHFGETILDSELQINRKALGAIIFNDSEKRLELESLLHPLVQEKVQRLKKSYKELGHDLCFYDVPLLFEKKLENQFDKIVLVYAPVSLQVQRLRDRNHLSHFDALTRLKAQLPMQDKVKRADFCLDNSTHTEDLKPQIDHLLNRLRS